MKAEEIVRDLLGYGLAVDEPGVLAAVKCFAAELEERSKADKADALQVQDATWHDIEDKHLADLAQTKKEMADAMAEMAEHSSKQLATAQAQVAVMAGLVDEMTTFLLKYENDLIGCGIGLEHDIDAFLRKEEQALSAALEVLWSGEAAWDTSDEFRDPSRKGPILWFPFSAALETGRTQLPLTEEDGKVVNVIVLDKQGEGE